MNLGDPNYRFARVCDDDDAIEQFWGVQQVDSLSGIYFASQVPLLVRIELHEV